MLCYDGILCNIFPAYIKDTILYTALHSQCTCLSCYSHLMAVGWYLVAVLAAFATVTVAQSNQYGFIAALAGESCRDIYQRNPTSHGKSGYYVIKIGNRPDFVYCDMELECGGEKGWIPVLKDGKRLLILFQLVEFLVIMLDVILLNSQLTKFRTVEYVEW